MKIKLNTIIKVVVTLAILLFLFWKELSDLVQFAGWTLSLCSAAVVVGLLVTRLRRGAEAMPIAGWPFVPLIYLISTVGIAGFAFFRRTSEGLLGLSVVGAGLVVYCALRLFGLRGALSEQR